jgi:hypothetical protein
VLETEIRSKTTTNNTTTPKKEDRRECKQYSTQSTECKWLVYNENTRRIDMERGLAEKAESTQGKEKPTGGPE